MPDVALVLMPFAAIERPSMALGILKASLNRAGIPSRVHYANLWFVDETSPLSCFRAERNPTECLVGEWIFSRAAFPDFSPDPDEYYARLPSLNPDSPVAPEFIESIQDLRDHAPGFIDRAARRILASGPRIVACSSMFQQHCASLALLRRVRELDDTVVTLLGGANCEGPMGRATHRSFPWVDYVVDGEADLVFPDLCRAIFAHGRSIDTLPAGVYGPRHRSSNRYPDHKNRLVLTRLDDSPTPDFDEYFEAIGKAKVRDLITPGLLIESSRGCWWGEKHHCTFCGLNGHGMSYRSKSPQRVLDEFTVLSDRYGITNFEVVDNIIEMSHLKSVLPHLAGRGLRIFYETKANLRYEQLRDMASAGVCWIQPGIESLHDDILHLMDKGTTGLINVQLLKYARELGVRLSWNFILSFPGENPAWYDQMVDWLPSLAHLQPPAGSGDVRYDRFSPYHMQPEKYGIALAPAWAYRWVYPLDDAAIVDLAYFFEDVPGSIREPSPSRWRIQHQGLRDVLKVWKKDFYKLLPPMLALSEDGDRVTVLDTRPCARARVQHFEGAAGRALNACHQAKSLRGIVDAVGETAETLAPLLADLVDRRLLLEQGGKYLALPLRGSVPALPSLTSYPGGYMNERAAVEIGPMKVAAR